ncbi:DUF370 domain-containing protein [Gloeothece verrucosa]|uniref:Regulatory protein n=1 Tax=Gloeothece verrucosa (strain PCC 7822) TaxID=497965 RepID=E0UN66_GLOV7|nr:DUF370 domain-containing protein [Gloeothece verrucosa]ADN18396.1 protein of unknown function DUF370 [Gloeothece verrucosa PCC 7822]
MTIEIVEIGFGFSVATKEIIAILDPDSSPIKRLISVAKAENRLIDSTNTRTVRSVIITRSNEVILSGVQAATIGDKFVNRHFQKSKIDP